MKKNAGTNKQLYMFRPSAQTNLGFYHHKDVWSWFVYLSLFNGKFRTQKQLSENKNLQIQHSHVINND